MFSPAPFYPAKSKTVLLGLHSDPTSKLWQVGDEQQNPTGQFKPTVAWFLPTNGDSKLRRKRVQEHVLRLCKAWLVWLFKCSLDVHQMVSKCFSLTMETILMSPAAGYSSSHPFNLLGGKQHGAKAVTGNSLTDIKDKRNRKKPTSKTSVSLVGPTAESLSGRLNER